MHGFRDQVVLLKVEGNASAFIEKVEKLAWN